MARKRPWINLGKQGRLSARGSWRNLANQPWRIPVAYSQVEWGRSISVWAQKSVELEARALRVLTGTVVDGTDKPVAGASLYPIRMKAPAQAPFLFHFNRRLLSSKTDKDGKYRLVYLPWEGFVSLVSAHAKIGNRVEMTSNSINTESMDEPNLVLSFDGIQ